MRCIPSVTYDFLTIDLTIGCAIKDVVESKGLQLPCAFIYFQFALTIT